MFKPKTFYFHKNTKNSVLYNHIIKANPQLKDVIEISTNTRVTDPKYNLISHDPKDYYIEKSTKIALLDRNCEWGLDPNGRSTDFLPSQMMARSCAYHCTYCSPIDIFQMDF